MHLDNFFAFSVVAAALCVELAIVSGIVHTLREKITGATSDSWGTALLFTGILFGCLGGVAAIALAVLREVVR